MKYLLLLVVVLGLSTVAFGQGTSSGYGGTVMVNTPKALFVLRGGVLAKYDATTLKPLQVFPLFGAAPTPPAEGADNDTVRKYFAEVGRRNAPAIMIPKDNALLVVVGDGFARINQDTLQVDAQADLRAPGTTEDTSRSSRNEIPGYTLTGTTLFLMRSKEMLSISITDGKILARSALPKELQPLPMPSFNNRGGSNRGGGGQ